MGRYSVVMFADHTGRGIVVDCIQHEATGVLLMFHEFTWGIIPLLFFLCNLLTLRLVYSPAWTILATVVVLGSVFQLEISEPLSSSSDDDSLLTTLLLVSASSTSLFCLPFPHHE